jgi:hypothetical protein
MQHGYFCDEMHSPQRSGVQARNVLYVPRELALQEL